MQSPTEPKLCRGETPVEKLFLQAESEGRITARTTVFTVTNSWLTDRTNRPSSPELPFGSQSERRGWLKANRLLTVNVSPNFIARLDNIPSPWSEVRFGQINR
ncbi:hypothetical protein AMECASPLE_033777 [Ameca splendens]|uniref:Uncharacterized protein n=1 Tax=Ameca splendens TaxID=208324 RepID=A0ABV0XVW2_9TELE